MEKPEKVIDASVVVKWFINEENSDKSIKIREDHISRKYTLIVPELMFLEVINTLRYKGFNIEKIFYINKSLWEFQFKIQKINNLLLDKAINVAIKNNISIYDAVYVTLAQLYGTFLITADKELYKIPNVIPLEKC
jgi:predicted nucleic acid-binding protein